MGCKVQAVLYSSFVVSDLIQSSLSAIITVWVDEERRHQILVTYSKEIGFPSLKTKVRKRAPFIIDEEFTVLYHSDCLIAISNSPRSKGNGSGRNRQAMIPSGCTFPLQIPVLRFKWKLVRTVRGCRTYLAENH